MLLDPRSFASLPVTELAARAHVSKPTVVRFCRSMGYDGLSDFKLKLAGTVSEGVPFIHRSVDLDDKVNDVLVKVIDNNVAAFLKYRNNASSAAIEKAAGALLNTCILGKRIEFFGAGNSGIVAQDAQHKFFRLGVSTVAYSDGHMQVMSASMMAPVTDYDQSNSAARLLMSLISEINVLLVEIQIGIIITTALWSRFPAA